MARCALEKHFLGGTRMTARFRAVIVVAAVALATFSLAIPAADAAVLKNRQTGETLKGALTPQRVNGKNLFKTTGGQVMYLDMDDWEVVEADPPATPPATPPAAPLAPAPAAPVPAAPAAPVPAAPAAPSTAAPAVGAPMAPPVAPVAAPGASLPGKAASGATKVYVFPITGSIKYHAMAEAVEMGLAEAAKQKCTVIIFRMNTPGGRVYIADKILKLLDKVDWATMVSFINGEDRESLSAGAYICLTTQKIFMAPGCTIGAATPYVRVAQPTNTSPNFYPSRSTSPLDKITHSGGITYSAEVEEKMMSVFRARFRNLANTRGYPVSLVEAMVDGTTTVIEVSLEDKTTVVSEDEAKRLEDAHLTDGKFKRGRAINPAGKLITLTSDEALQYKLCAAIVADEKELLAKIGIDQYQLIDAKWAPAWIEKTAMDRKKTIDDLVSVYRTQRQGASMASSFLSSVADVQKDKAARLAHLKECARAVTGLEKYANDERYDYRFPPSLIEELKQDIETLNTSIANGVRFY